MNLTLSSLLSLVPIEVRKDKKNFLVENKISDDYYEMPEVCIEAINMIRQGNQLGQIEKCLKEQYPDEEIDLLDFANQLLELNLIVEIDGVKVDSIQLNKRDLGFTWISQKMGKFFFNRLTYIIYFILFLINLILFKVYPSLFPHYKDIFVFDYMFLNILLWLVLTFVLVLFHEIGHILSMRAYSLPTKLELGHRLFLVVLETDISSVWKLPAKSRNVLYLAGICFDIVTLTFAIYMQLFFANNSVILVGIMKVIILDTFLRMVYQCCVFMKTDIYYVVENVSGCYNLMENAQQFLRKRLSSKKKLVQKNEIVFEGEKRTILFYSIFYLVGVLISVSLYVIYYIPQLLYAWKNVLPGFEKTPTSFAFWDAALFSLQNIIMFILLLYSWRKKYLYG
jgi:putative peptide zinc metalloprotease protein